MIKIDYEGAWKDLKEEIPKVVSGYEKNPYFTDEAFCAIESIKDKMNDLEQKHTHNYIELKKRADKEIADYCLKKYAEIYLENIYLKKKLGEKREKDKVFKVHIVGVTDDCYEYDVTERMNAERLAYYDNAFREGKKAKYRGKKIRIVQLDISLTNPIKEII